MKSKAKNILIDTSKLVDKKFLAQRQLINFHEFMEHQEYELALESLIELSDEVEDRFTYEFWLNLDKAAGLMGLTHVQEIIKNKISDFWFNQAKNFSLKEKEIEAEIYYLTTEEGGRSSFVYSGYRDIGVHFIMVANIIRLHKNLLGRLNVIQVI